MKQTIVINGRFLEQKLTGVQRYALEMTKALDSIIPLHTEIADVILAVPSTVSQDKLPHLNNIHIVQFGKKGGIFWEQLNLARYLKHHHAVGIHFCNTVPLFASRGIVCIHDITYKANPQFVTTKKLKLIQLWHNFMTAFALHHCDEIITVSQFSKRQIIDYYHTSEDKITVVYNAWQHFSATTKEVDISEIFPFLKKDGYYFSLATVAKNKNFQWVTATAKLNPDSVFAIAGSVDMKKLDLLGGNLSNIHYLGYVSDDDAKLLMKQCKAFLFPSLYEGFGIPPLEALSMGAPVICSNATSLPEIFEDSVHYIDPFVPAKRIDDLLLEKVSSPHKILDKFSWEKSAAILLTVIQKVV